MRLENLVIVARREFGTRIRSKGFWISTVLLPLFMMAMLFVPTLVMSRTEAHQRLVLVDATDRVADRLVALLGEGGVVPPPIAGDTDTLVRFDVEHEPAPEGEEATERLRKRLDERVLAEQIDAWVWIDEERLAADRVEYHAESVSNVLTQEVLEEALTRAVREVRLAEAGYDAERIAELSRTVDLQTVRVTERGSREEVGGGGLILAIGLFFMLYTVILVYGQQVLQGVLEEKSSRIVEVIVSTVRPVEMMGGKLLGICAIAFVQLGIWITTAVVLTAPAVVTALVTLPEDLRLPRLEAPVVMHFFGLFLVGFFLFASFYAMIGSAFNDLQEAQQLASVAVIFVVAPVVFLMPVINDPESTLAVIASLIPPLTPLVMMLRIAVKMPPAWQILLGYALTVGFTLLLIWFCARIYRVGILMYGKKPTLQELWRWARYG